MQAFLKKYHIHTSRKLGGGAYGRVYVCTEVSTQKEYAIKIINLQGVNVLRFNRECNVMRRLENHENVLSYIDSYLSTSNSMGFIVLELGHTDFHTKLTGINRMSTSFDALGFIKGIISAVYACHQLGYIHGDIKLENIICVKDDDGQDQYKICDFGYVRKIREAWGTVYGSVTYSAPESFATKMYTPPEYNRSLLDVWAIGVVLYTTVEHKDPFDVDDSKKTIARIVSKQIHVNPEWDPRVHFILTRALEKNPSKRISMTDLYEYSIINL